jgi:hypothetical protein
MSRNGRVANSFRDPAVAALGAVGQIVAARIDAQGSRVKGIYQRADDGLGNRCSKKFVEGKVERATRLERVT